MKKADTKVIANVRVGRPDVEPTAPTHVRGVLQGNRHYRTQRGRGIEERSTGIRPGSHGVIDPRMPKLTPA